MGELWSVCGRDVAIIINGTDFLQAERAELRKTSELHGIRACFCSDDAARVRGRSEYKLNLRGLRLKAPFENLNIYDLDDFEVRIRIDDTWFELSGCMWDDFTATADQTKFREYISITALTMHTTRNEQTGGIHEGT